MKYRLFLSAVALAIVLNSSAHADLVPSNSYVATPVYVDPNSSNSIVSYDWNANNLYYETADPSFDLGGFFQANSANPSAPISLFTVPSNTFAGASVVSIGKFVYFNDSDFANQNIYAYGPVNGTPTTTLASQTANFALTGHAGQIFITGAADFGTNHIYTSTLQPNGSLTSSPARDLGVNSGSSGPIAFDAAGDLFYAPGFGDSSIYEWSAADVAAALADPTHDPLTAAGHQWLDYSSIGDYGSFSGGTSMLVYGNELLLTLTNFDSPSELVSFGISNTETYDGSSNVVLQSNDTLGELRLDDGGLFLSDDNTIFKVTPEPSTASLLLLGGLLFLGFRRWRTIRNSRLIRQTAVIAMLVWGTANFAQAVGPFSPDADQPNSTGVAAADPNIYGWATGVVSFNPGPVQITTPGSVNASFGTPSNALGPSDATASNPFSVVSLGDGGSITLSFAQPIKNGAGPDLAVYENGFAENGVPNAYFLELATVAVSSNGVNFFTFPSISLTQTTTQVGGFGTLDPTYLYNLAGSEIAGYGTPFDLSDLAGVSPLLNINDITEVRITDVVGDINPAFGTMDDASNPIFDSLYASFDGAYGPQVNHIINDPFPTDFTTGGFDLDAVAEIREPVIVAPEPTVAEYLLMGLIPLGWFARRRFFHLSAAS